MSGLERGAQDKRNTMWPELVRYCDKMESPPDMLTDWLVVNNREQSLVERQLIKNGQPHHVLGKEYASVKRWSHITKLELLLKGCQESSLPYVATMDAFDVTYGGPLASLRLALDDKPLLISADIMTWPRNAPSREKINAGVWIGRRDYMVQWLQKAVAASKTRADVKNDQYWYLALHDKEWIIDYERKYIQTELRPKFVQNDWVKAARLINLRWRADRLQASVKQYEHWPFVLPERFEAIDGKGHGTKGCRLSHMGVIQQTQELGLPHVFILEDDFVLAPRFTERISLFLEAVPDDWDILWIGGHHNRRPTVINEQVSKVVKCVNCHAYVVRANMYQVLLDYWGDPVREHRHIDNEFQSQQSKYNIYCPTNFLVGQAGGTKSNISWKTRQRTDFWSAIDNEIERPKDRVDRAREERLGTRVVGQRVQAEKTKPLPTQKKCCGG